MRSLVQRLGSAGLAAALAVWAAGWAFERVRFGADDAAAAARIEAELGRTFASSADALGRTAEAAAADHDLLRSAPRDPASVRRLFDVVAAALGPNDTGRRGVTVYVGSVPLAWAGSVSDLPRDRLAGPSALFVSAGALGPRLVRVEPVVDRTMARAPRLGTVVVEVELGRPEGPPGSPSAPFVIGTSVAPVRLTVESQASPPGAVSFVIRSTAGAPLATAELAPADLETARGRLRATTRGAVLSVVGVTLLLCAVPVLDWRRRARSSGPYLSGTAVIIALVVAGRWILRVAGDAIFGARAVLAPLDLLVTALAAAALTWLAFDLVAHWRLARPRPRLLAGGTRAVVRIAGVFVAASAAAGLLLAAYERILGAIVSQASLDVLHFSLHPLSAPRLAIAFGLVLLHAAILWTAAIVLRTGGVLARTPRLGTMRAVAVAAWVAGIALAAVLVALAGLTLPWWPWLAAVVTTGVSAAALRRFQRQSRHRSQAARLAALFLVLAVPAFAMYPSLLAFATAAKERLLATQYAPTAMSQRDELQVRLRHALEEVDAFPTLEPFVTGVAETAPTVDRAFLVWAQTDLALYRLTSAVELYGGGGQLVSRFALNLPEYTADRHVASGCSWELFEELSPFGSTERHVLEASRGICRSGRVLGAIVVRVMLDYRTLPFIASQSPYLESLRPDQQAPPEGAPGRDIEFVVYGWSRAPLYASGTSVWPLPDAVFNRMVASREPIWSTLTRDGDSYRVYLANDRGGIFAIGYPETTGLGHLVNLAELGTLMAVLYVALLAAATLVNAVVSRTPSSGRALLREIRASFYRKLFLAFVSAAVVPVVILAVATRTYFAAQFRAGIEDAAAQTALVAERLVEDYATLQRRGAGAFAAIDDQIMVLVGRAIGEDVNLFDHARLQATSERDLFASRLLSTRTPADVYRTIVLDRLPTFVGVEQSGDFRYLLAAAPVRAGDQEGVVTVPVTLRQQEIERQIDELDRRILFAAVLFVLVGAAIGYWMAERIADPVNRLTRATRRITRGDLDAHAMATSADELGRLIADFNEMARELKRQRAELERTQRLEAWADMARQVAHDIKNPLTPIQLSAEHARRVNADRGRPLSPVLDDCVNAILSQVRLLRQISAEFSSFASSPTPRPERTDLAALVEEVVAPYRVALAGRVALEVHSEPGLPMVVADRTLLARALTNVMENGLHAMPGGGTLSIGTSGSGDPAGVVRLEIRDTGVGMGPEAVARIFEPYFSTKASGTGLGLTIAKRNVELNGGTIGVESTKGVGTRVTITLPVGT